MPPLEPMRERRIMGRIAPEEFIGRADQLQQIVRLAEPNPPARGLFLRAAPASGATELLRQSYDHLFQQRAGLAPFYFAFSPQDASAAIAAQRFLQSFLAQLIAFRRHDAALVNASLAIAELVEMAAPTDAEWIEQVVATCERVRGDADAFTRCCLSVVERAATHGAPVLALIDDVHLIEAWDDGAARGALLAQIVMHAGSPFVLSGLRRTLCDLIDAARLHSDQTVTLHLQRLDEPDARRLIAELARRKNVAINDQTRDLIAQQFACNPFYITALISAAHEQNISLTSFLNCQQLYVNELMGGRLNRYFAGVLEAVAPQAQTRRALLRTLYEAATSNSGGGKATMEVWRKRIGLETDVLQATLHKLHVRELVNVEGELIEVAKDSIVWMDYLQTRYRLEVAADTRALVVAETLRRSLKRAPETMARYYKQEATLNLKGLLASFDCQRVPVSLLRYEKFARLYRGAEPSEISEGLSVETDLISLPQAVHIASCAAFNVAAGASPDDGRCAVAHCFDAGVYTDASEVVWLAAQLESKTEAGRGLTQLTCDRLTAFARACGFGRVRLWIIAAEGFTTEACELLDERDVYGSSVRQIEFLQAMLKGDASVAVQRESALDEFEMVIPMGGDTELIAAHTLEQIARRIKFPPEAINQIKTALVEACINATEHSHSPDRKIYQQFRVESDRLVVTVSSRGVVVPPFAGGESASQHNAHNNGHGEGQSSERRGWGLKLIRTLMDEVEFERVDDGSRLRMTKYLQG